MCKYCEEGKELDILFNESIFKEKFVLVHRIENSNINILANLGFVNEKNKMVYQTVGANIRINYCHMCGRRLNN